MALRKISVIDTAKSRSRSVYELDVKTLRELKEELSKLGHNVTGTRFHEGISNTAYTMDDQVFPESLPYKGVVVTDLVFMITKEDKKITSGGVRSNLYDEIKALGLQSKCVELYGKNFTMCSNAALQEVIATYSIPESKNIPEKDTPVAKEKKANKGRAGSDSKAKEIVAKTYEKPAVISADAKSKDTTKKSNVDTTTVKAIEKSLTMLVNILTEESILTEDDRVEVLSNLYTTVPPVDAGDNNICEDEYSDINWDYILSTR